MLLALVPCRPLLTLDAAACLALFLSRRLVLGRVALGSMTWDPRSCPSKAPRPCALERSGSRLSARSMPSSCTRAMRCWSGPSTSPIYTRPTSTSATHRSSISTMSSPSSLASLLSDLLCLTASRATTATLISRGRSRAGLDASRPPLPFALQCAPSRPLPPSLLHTLKTPSISVFHHTTLSSLGSASSSPS